MSQTTKAAKSVSANFCVATLFELAEACCADAKNANIGPVLAPFALQGFFRMVANSLDDRPVTPAEIDLLATRLAPLLKLLVRSGIQDSDRFNHQVDDHLRSLRDLIP
jgi:hypothetical protein